MIREFEISKPNNPDETMADYLREQGIRLILPCGGNGTCGRCRIVVSSDMGTAEVLACQKKVSAYQGKTVCIDIPDEIVVSEPSCGIRPASDGSSTEVHWKAAVDLGSTTIETEAVSDEGEIIGTVSRQNPQRSYGADVLSRINAASEGTIAASDMQRLAESTIQGEIQALSEEHGLNRYPDEMVIAGNTTMEHLLTADDVASLGHAPFDPGDISLRDISRVFSDEGMPVYLMPGITAFVGADILSGIYALDMDRSEKYSLLVDLGTNGEMVYGNRDGFVVASTAAGPAFEAANISCGCAGVSGAIRDVRFNGHTARLSLIPWDDETACYDISPGERMQYQMKLRARRPAGLCGSGLVSAAAGMKKAGIIDENGTYTRDSWIRNGFPLWRHTPAAPDEKDIVITQDDIHQLLLAKSAIRSGIEILLESVKTRPSVVYLSGGFGSGISVEAAIDIGLFPDVLYGVDIIPAGNTSLMGARKFITDDRACAVPRLSHISEMCTEIRLGDAADFEEKYISNIKI